ncbi:Phosphatidylethanolamine-binding domain-containing protein [Phytophthora infestans]|uniref:Phosphatidylethanolamine-binding domain-containing protein n=1 Tax=Phytophthora infestans TaxID=4787 RepID=A0A833T234_PHYIN|nr:Phosphatidylethanolamine-binding domain-containing protein [Phytophthora infestans]KAF4140767.1 Phosphatidylethanolamine-binding domain-containing protein [Phytophthora infestans]
MKSYGSKLPLQPLAPASFFLRGAGFLVATAFVVSMVFMVAVMQSVGVDGIASNQLQNDGASFPALRLAADTALVQARFLHNIPLSVDAEARGNVRVSIAFNQDHPVTHGQFVPMNEAKNAPSVSIEGGVTGSADRYTYVLIDIDAPDPKAPTHAPFLHYIVAGLAANGQSTSQQDTVEVVSYYPVTPPIGEHRYVSLLFRQQESDPSAPDADLTAKRANFDVDEFTKKHKLDLVDKSYFHSRPAAQDN